VATSGPLRFTERGAFPRIGPRLFRVHIGAGGPGISSGVGPVSGYVPIRTPRPHFVGRLISRGRRPLRLHRY